MAGLDGGRLAGAKLGGANMGICAHPEAAVLPRSNKLVKVIWLKENPILWLFG
jgi:hypothetical protein